MIESPNPSQNDLVQCLMIQFKSDIKINSSKIKSFKLILIKNQKSKKMKLSIFVIAASTVNAQEGSGNGTTATAAAAPAEAAPEQAERQQR